MATYRGSLRNLFILTILLAVVIGLSACNDRTTTVNSGSDATSSSTDASTDTAADAGTDAVSNPGDTTDTDAASSDASDTAADATDTTADATDTAADATDTTADAMDTPSDSSTTDAAQDTADTAQDTTADAGGDASDPYAADMIPYTCTDPNWTPGTCTAGTTNYKQNTSRTHIPYPQPIVYTDNPPSSGPHRPIWAKWGQYKYLPPPRWVHNLEHGGIAFLYNPCADSTVVDELLQIARQRPADSTGKFRWVLTPYPGLPSEVAVVAWQWTYEANCVKPTEINSFIDNHYRKSPEDLSTDGAYDYLWIGR